MRSLSMRSVSIRSLASAITLLLLSAACGPPQVKITTRSRAPAVELTAAQELAASAADTYSHPACSIHFPSRAAGFVRLPVKAYNPKETDVGVSYGSPTMPWFVVTIYVYPRPKTRRGAPTDFAAHFERELVEVRKGRRDIRRIASGTPKGPLARAMTEGRSREFEFSGGAEFGGLRVRSVIAVFPLDDWLVKYRLTSPVAQRDSALPEGIKLLDALGLPPLGLPSER